MNNKDLIANLELLAANSVAGTEFGTDEHIAGIAADRIEKLEAERDDWKALQETFEKQLNSFIGKCKQRDKRIEELEARLQRVRDLPQRWRDHCLKTTEEYTDVRGCADELQAALETSDE